ncbi:MAG TPA: LysM peptidoglycan-binding domain-containing protein [Nocardioidaceae bacterium]|nr:LysM peptidoglycan-binding domain-containing protein [Nocardioidaceae bacterium]
MRRPGQWARALVTFVAMAAILIGVPWALIVWVGNPMPPEGLALNAGLTDDALIGLLAVAVWVIWAQLVIATVVAVVEEVRGVDFRSLPGVFGSQHDVARRAVAAIALAIVSSTAAAGTASAVTSSHTVTTTPRKADPQADADTEAPRAAKQTGDDLRLATVTAEQSDLWTIAENHLGSGERWPEIKDLNQGRVMSDGRTFRSANLLMPGWKLLMPADAKGLPLASDVEERAVEVATVTYTVQAGDSLSDIAKRLMGDPSRYNEIFELNANKPQPDGQRLTDPDEIWAGWTLEVPRVADHRAEAPREGRHADHPVGQEQEPTQQEQQPQEEQQAPRRQAEPEHTPERVTVPERAQGEADHPRQHGAQPPEQHPSTAPHSEGPRSEGPRSEGPRSEGESSAPATRSHSDRPSASSDSEPVSSVSSEDEPGVPVLAVAGVGAVVAAGLVGLLRLRRTWQRSGRRPGQRTPGPGLAAIVLEEELTSGADLEGVDLVDHALRGLLAWCRDGGNGGMLPVIQAARITETGVELYLAEAASLPDPWESLRGDTAWMLTRDAEGFAVFNDGGPAPYPALVALGADPEGGQILVDLEFLGTLSLEGPRSDTERMLAALTTALATSQWADHLDVTIVGTHPDLEGVMRTGRVKYLPEVGDLLSDLAVRVREDASAWSELEVRDVTDARVNQQPESAGLCVPEIVLLAAELTPEQRVQLARLLEDLPRVAVAAVTTGDAVGDWRLHPDADGDDQRDWILEPVGLRLRPARLDDATFERILELLRTADEPPEGPPVDLAEPTLGEPSAPSLPPESAGRHASGRHASDHVWPRPRSGEATWRAPSTDEDERRDDDLLEASSSRMTSAPVIDNLGSPRVVNPAVEIPDNRLPRVLAFLCYLAGNRGCSHEQLDEAMFPGARVNPDTRTRYINYARTLLGKGPDGMDYLPRRNYTDLSPDVVTTWELFHNLVGDDPFSAPTDRLERALSLVRGRPYEGGKPAWYGWSERTARRMYDLIADTACALADRRFKDGQWRAAVDAALLGWSIEPVQQWLWRVHIQGLRALGDVDEARRIAQERNAFSEELEFELEPETEALFDELGLFGSVPAAG